MLKKFKLVYEIEFTGEGHFLFDKSIEEVMETFMDCVIGSLPIPDETLNIKITKKPLDKITEK